jgi:HK97 family phage prohead protease
MELKTFAWKVKSLDEEGCFTGLASTYGEPADLGGDVVTKGAFSKSIQDQGRGLPILWQHRADSPVGLGTISDHAAGLGLVGRLVMADPVARRAYAHLKAGSVRGLSIGYEPIKSSPRPDGGRNLHEVKLHEISIVTLPMNERAQVASVKALLQSLSSLSADDLDDDEVSDLRGIAQHVKRLLPAAAQPDNSAALKQWQAVDAALKKLL